MHEKRFPSRAADSRTNLRVGKYLAARTVNSFSGGHEWSHSLMVYAITGHISFLSSDTFWYVFPFQLVKYAQGLSSARSSVNTDFGDDSVEDLVGVKDVTAATCTDQSIEDELAELANQVAEETSPAGAAKAGGGGARVFSVDGKIVLLTQAESYHHRGDFFVDFSPIEFECIVDVLPDRHIEEESRGSRRGRPARRGFPFSSAHPLARTHKGFIRAKMLTPVLGGAPPPTWKNPARDGIRKGNDVLAQYLLCSFTAWGAYGPTWAQDTSGLLQLCDAWDRASAPLLNRQRCRHIRNVMKKVYQNSYNEQVATDWRNRGAEYWKRPRDSARGASGSGPAPADREFEGALPVDQDVFDLIVRAASGSASRRAGIASITETFCAVFGDPNGTEGTSMGPRPRPSTPVFHHRGDGLTGDDSLSRVAGRLQKYETPPLLRWKVTE
jgi:hypothetical protein